MLWPLFLDTIVCHFCGNPNGTKRCRCGQCKEVYYCNSNCQERDWKRNHKPPCTFVSSTCRESIWIEVEQVEGRGLANGQINHIFSDKETGMEYAKQALGGTISPALISPMPF